MRLSIVGVAAAAMVLAGCSSSSSSTSGSSGSTGTTTTASSTTGHGATASSTSTSGSTSTTSTSGTTGHSNGSTGGSGSTSGSGSTGSACTPTSASSGSTGTTNDFSCLGHVTPPATTPGPATLTLTLHNQNGGVLAEGQTVKACDDSDTTCATPQATGTTDASGTVALTVTLGSTPFVGYFDVSGQNTNPDGGAAADPVLPMLVYFPPVTGSASATLIGVRKSDADTIAFATSVTLDPTRGQVIGNVADCGNVNASGAVTAASNADSSTVNMYFRFNASYGQEVPAPGLPDTDQTGNYIIANVPVGAPTVSAYVHQSCALIGQRTVQVRAGTITNVLVVPQ